MSAWGDRQEAAVRWAVRRYKVRLYAILEPEDLEQVARLGILEAPDAPPFAVARFAILRAARRVLGPSENHGRKREALLDAINRLEPALVPLEPVGFDEAALARLLEKQAEERHRFRQTRGARAKERARCAKLGLPVPRWAQLRQHGRGGGRPTYAG